MQIKITDLGHTCIEALLNNQFGVEVALDSREEIIAATIWTELDFGGEPNAPGGFICGQIVRQMGSFPRYTVIIDDGRVNRERVHGLMTDILNANWRA